MKNGALQSRGAPFLFKTIPAKGFFHIQYKAMIFFTIFAAYHIMRTALHEEHKVLFDGYLTKHPVFAKHTLIISKLLFDGYLTGSTKTNDLYRTR